MVLYIACWGVEVVHDFCYGIKGIIEFAQFLCSKDFPKTKQNQKGALEKANQRREKDQIAYFQFDIGQNNF